MKTLTLSLFVSVLLFTTARAQYLYPNTNPPANVTLAWDASPSSGVVGYRLYYGAAGTRQYTNVITVTSSTTLTLSNLVRGATYRFAATAVTSEGLESDFSNELAYQPSLKPSSPVLRLAMTSDGRLVLGSGEAYGLYGVERTQDFAGWQALATARADRDGRFALLDREALSTAFYRAGQI